MNSYRIEPPDSWWFDEDEDEDEAADMETERRIDERLEQLAESTLPTDTAKLRGE
jgi:hypothetical protein